LKTATGGKGKNVVVGIMNLDAAKAAFNTLCQKGQIFAEQMIAGGEYRFLVVGGQCVAVAQREPAHVVGDGGSTVEQLINRLNQTDPERGLPFERLREKIQFSPEVTRVLEAQSLSYNHVPGPGSRVNLSLTSNIAQGGTSVDVTEQVHPKTVAMVEYAAQMVGLDTCGLDFICSDISKAYDQQRCAILELNRTPGLRPHLGANPARDVAGPIVEALFPKGSRTRVPTVAVTESLGKTTTVQLVARLLATKYQRVAKSTTQGAWVGEHQLAAGDVAGGRMATTLLQHPSVEAGVFELARGGLIRGGTVLDKVNVGILLNVHDNHVGLQGIGSREQMLAVKRQVLDIATDMAIVNADDQLCASVVGSLRAKHIGLISTQAHNEITALHKQQGGLVGQLTVAGVLEVTYRHQRLLALPLTECPISHGGAFTGVATNLLAALMASLFLGCSARAILLAARAFQPSAAHNPQRNVISHGHPYTLLISHADGPVAAGALVPIAMHYAKGRRRILLCTAGDRSDEFIMATARSVAGGFDDYVVTNSRYLRGRELHEMPNLLARGLMEAGVCAEKINVEPDAHRAEAAVISGLSSQDFLCKILTHIDN
jgi:cyanophycin synthetase